MFDFCRRGFIKRDGFGASEGTPAPLHWERLKREKKKKTFKILFYTKSYSWIEHDLEIFFEKHWTERKMNKWNVDMGLYGFIASSQLKCRGLYSTNSREKSFHFITSTQNQKKKKLQQQKKSVQHWIKF